MTPSTTIVDGGSFTEGGITLHNAGGGVLRRAPAAAGAPGLLRRLLLQRRAPMLYEHGGRRPAEVGVTTSGIGHPTGIDLPGEVAGLLPTPQWRDQLYKEAQSPNSPGGQRRAG